MKFVWLTNNYCVNIESIFSLEVKYSQNDEYIKWKNNYEVLLDSYKKSLIPLKTENGNLLVINENSTQEDLELYAQLVADEIYDKIGSAPDEDIVSYQIILSTGLKVNIAEDKFIKIKEYINNEEKREA